MQDLFADAMQQLLGTHCTPATVREIELDGDSGALWQHIEASGFVDALVDDSEGGAGLSLAEIFSVVLACGYYAVPAPVAQTMLVRAMGSRSDAALPGGPITIASACMRNADGSLQCTLTPFGRLSEWIVFYLEGEAWLLPAAAAHSTPAGGNGCLDADFYWPSRPDDAVPMKPQHDWGLMGAAVTAGLIAGALEKIFEMTVAYANDRIQFGKPIGKLQAVQQQLSVLAEHVFAARMAAQIGFQSDTATPNRLRGAVAKERTSAVAAASAAIAHAVHGAMGFTEEYDLQLYTRRLHEWRMAYGAETYWCTQIGDAALTSAPVRALDFVREGIMTQ